MRKGGDGRLGAGHLLLGVLLVEVSHGWAWGRQWGVSQLLQRTGWCPSGGSGHGQLAGSCGRLAGAPARGAATGVGRLGLLPADARSEQEGPKEEGTKGVCFWGPRSCGEQPGAAPCRGFLGVPVCGRGKEAALGEFGAEVGPPPKSVAHTVVAGVLVSVSGAWGADRGSVRLGVLGALHGCAARQAHISVVHLGSVQAGQHGMYALDQTVAT